MAYKLSELGKYYLWSFVPLAKCTCTTSNHSAEMQRPSVKQKPARCRDFLPTTAAAGHGAAQGSGWNHPPQLALHVPQLPPFFPSLSICQSTRSPDEWANSPISSPLLLLTDAYQIIAKKNQTPQTQSSQQHPTGS